MMQVEGQNAAFQLQGGIALGAEVLPGPGDNGADSTAGWPRHIMRQGREVQAGTVGRPAYATSQRAADRVVARLLLRELVVDQERDAALVTVAELMSFA